MRNLFFVFILLLGSSGLFAQQNNDLKPPEQDSTRTQDTLVISTEDMQAAEKLYNEGVNLYSEGSYRKALKKFAGAVKIKPNFPKAYYNSALCYIALSMPDSAMAELDNVIMLTSYDKAYYLRGTLWMEMNDASAAKNDFEQAVAADSSTVKGESFYYLGGIEFEAGNYEKAIQLYDSSLKYKPDYAYAYNDRGSAWRMLEKYDNALADYQKAIKADPKLKIAYSNIASVKRKQGKPDEAITYYTKAIEIDPKFVLAYNARGVVYKDQGEFQKALNDFDKAIELDDKYAFAYNNRGNVKYKMKEYEAAVKDYNKAIETDKDYAIAYLNRGIAKEMLRDKKGACEDWEKAYKLGVEAAKTYLSQCKN